MSDSGFTLALLIGLMAVADVLESPSWSADERRKKVRTWENLTLVMLLVLLFGPYVLAKISGWLA